MKKMFEFSDFYTDSVKSFYIKDTEDDAESQEKKPIILPVDQFVCLGREIELSRIKEKFSNQNLKILTLFGDSGIGKTALAVEYANQNLEIYEVVLFIPAQTSYNISFTFLKLFKRLGLPVRDTYEDNMYSIREYLDDLNSPALLIFDDAENIDSIRNFFPNKAHILVTSNHSEWENGLEINPVTLEISGLVLRKYSDINGEALISLGQGNCTSLELIGRFVNYYNITAEEYTNMYNEAKLTIKKIEFAGFSPLEMLAAYAWKTSSHKIIRDHPYFLSFLSCLTYIEFSGISQEIALKIFFYITRISEVSKYEVFVYSLAKLGIVSKDAKNKLKIHPFIARIIISQNHQSQQYTAALQQVFTQELGDLDILSTFCITGKAALHIKRLSKFIYSDTNLEAGLIYYEKGRYDLKIEQNYSEALQSLLHSIDILNRFNHTEKYQLYYGAGLCNLKLHKAEDALEFFTKVSEECKSKELNLRAKVGICNCLSELGRISDLEKNLKSKEILSVNQPDTVFSLILSLIEIGVLNQDFHTIIKPYEPIIEDQVYAPENVILTLTTVIKIILGFSCLELFKKCNKYLNFLANLIGQAQPNCEESEELLGFADNLIDSICQFVGPNHEILSDYHIILSNLCIASKKSEEASNHLKIALEIRVQRYGLDDPKVAKILYFLSKSSTNKSKSLKYALDSERIIRNTIGDDHIFYAYCCERLGLLYISENQYTDSNEFLLKSLHIRQKNFSISHYECCKSYAALAKLAQTQEDYEKAIELYEKALNYMIDSRRHMTSDVTQWALAAFNLCKSIGQPIKALEFRLKQVSALKSHFDYNQDEVLALLVKTAEYAEKIENYTEAIKCYLDSFEISKEKYSDDETEFLIKASENYSKLGKLDESKKYITMALEMRKKRYGDISIEAGRIIIKIAGLYLERCMWNEAIHEFESAYEIYNNTVNEELEKAELLCNFGYCELKIGADQEANKYLKESLKIRKEKAGRCKEEVGICYHYLGLANMRNKSQALRYLEKALRIFLETSGENHQNTQSVAKIISDLNKFN